MSDAQILDRGYRRYDGPRLGGRGAFAAVVRQSAARALGIRRRATSKALPIVIVVMAYLPGVVFVGVAALFREEVLREAVLPSYSDYYGFITSALVLFVAFLAPELLCSDRRNGLLGLSLASPLTRGGYLAAKATTVALMLALVTLGPPLLLLLAYASLGQGPDGFVGFLELLGRVVASGAAVAAVYTAVSLAIASLTTRRAVAAAAVLIVLVLSGTVTSLLVDEGGVGSWVHLFDLLVLPTELVGRIYGDVPSWDLSTPVVLGANLAWTALGALVVWVRYARLAVTR